MSPMITITPRAPPRKTSEIADNFLVQSDSIIVLGKTVLLYYVLRIMYYYCNILSFVLFSV